MCRAAQKAKIHHQKRISVSQGLGNGVGPVGVICRGVEFTAVLWGWRKLWVGKDLWQLEVRSGSLQLLPTPIWIMQDLTEFGGNTAGGISFHFLTLTFARKQVVGRAWAPCAAAFNMHEEKIDPQLPHDIMGFWVKVINPTCKTREISDYGKKMREAFELTAGTMETLARKRATTNIRLPRIN